jgi:transcriptional regulator with XRE-family HTH domain
VIALKHKRTVTRYKNQGFLKALGDHCHKLRVSKGFSIDRMAREGELLSPSVIHRLETGAGAVTVSVLLRYAEVLDIPLKRLMDFPYEKPKAVPSGTMDDDDGKEPA